MKKALTTIIAFDGRLNNVPDVPTPRFSLIQIDIVQPKIVALFLRSKA